MATAIPSRALLAIRPHESGGVLAAVGVVGATYAATPFVFSGAIDEFEISTGLVAVLSTAQVATFMAANLTAGRRLSPSGSLLRWSLLTLCVLNALSAFAPSFLVLTGLRALAGIPMGLITWVSWAASAADGRRRGEVAAIGPLVTAFAAPLMAMAVNWGGLRGVYLLVAGLTLACLPLPSRVESFRDQNQTRNPISAPLIRPLLVALSLLSMGGAGVFLFGGVIAANLGLSPLATSLGFSMNALAGIPSARFSGRRPLPGVWIAVIAACALFFATTQSQVVFYVIMVLWGLSFWSAIPEVFSLLADRSKHPADRVGDAQAMMSLGRMIGPSAGGLVVSFGGFTALGWIAAAVLMCSALIVEIVSRR